MIIVKSIFYGFDVLDAVCKRFHGISSNRSFYFIIELNTKLPPVRGAIFLILRSVFLGNRRQICAAGKGT